jgi:hypothetical protein
MRGSGGTDGGVGIFFLGLFLSALGIYLFFDSVRVTTAAGLISGMLGGGRHGGGGGGGMWETTSMGIIFVPFLIGVVALFQDSNRKWAWWILYLGLAVISIEILSRIRFFMTTKLTHLLGMMVLFAAGVGLMLRSYLPSKSASNEDDE